MRSPSGVSMARGRSRRNNSPPSSPSSSLMARVSEGCATWHSSAALVKFSVRATARKYRTWCISMLAFPKGRLQLSIHVPQVAIATWGGRNGKGPPTICSMHGGYRRRLRSSVSGAHLAQHGQHGLRLHSLAEFDVDLARLDQPVLPDDELRPHRQEMSPIA